MGVTAWSAATTHSVPSGATCRGGRSRSARFRAATPQGSAPPPTGIVVLGVADRFGRRISFWHVTRYGLIVTVTVAVSVTYVRLHLLALV
ncbi:hypothetical protein ACIBAG_28360 [Streptomyces sp. NPDC051243]|uniref:hypothetical protein n=1 Tax=Streptomyces sp. NPDC051243 TaxID=3365646 RepID=UPI0037AD63F1